MKLRDILTEMPRVPYNDIEDESGFGSKWERRQHAEQVSKNNEWRASEEVKQLAQDLKQWASRVYNTFQAPFINYKVRTVNVKISNVKGYNLHSPAVMQLDTRLKKEFNDQITVRRAGSSVLYHIPYDIFELQR